jgi:CBS domain-containing protein
MLVSDILRLKANQLFSLDVAQPMSLAAQIMAEKDIGSLVVMQAGELAGMLTFREVIQWVVKHPSLAAATQVQSFMEREPLTCTPETHLDEVRRMMLERHARYLPVMNGKEILGVISFYDVAKAVVDHQNFENKMLKAYIKDWPEEHATSFASVSQAPPSSQQPHA